MDSDPLNSLVVHHPWGLRYLALKAVLAPLRLVVSLAQSFEARSFQLPEGVNRRRIEVPSRDDGRTISVDVYEQATELASEHRAAHVNWHGSGFVIPSLGTDAAFCAFLASTTSSVILDADYRKAPEYTFPAAFNDALDVVAYARKTYGSPPSVSGFSAGGNLAMAVATSLPRGAVQGVASLYGVSDLTTASAPPPPSSSSEAQDTPPGRTGLTLAPFFNHLFRASLFLPSHDRHDPRVAPIKAAIERWPSHIFIACGTEDELHGPALVLVQKLRDGGMEDVQWMSIEGEGHSFDKFAAGNVVRKKHTDRMYEGVRDLVMQCA